MPTHTRALAAGAAAAAAVTLAACTPEPQVTRADYARYFADYCAGCHGADARGGGPQAAGMDPAPPDLTSIAARHGGTFPMVEVMSQIDGYGRGGAMPEFGAFLLDDRQVMVETAAGEFTPAPERLAGMAAYLRSLQRQAAP